MNILSNEQIQAIAPAVMSTEHKPGLSDHYTQIPTIQVVEDMRKLGWEPIQAIGVKARKGGNSAIKKHLVKFRNEGVYMADKDGNVDSYIEILLTNLECIENNPQLIIQVMNLTFRLLIQHFLTELQVNV